MTMMPFHNGWSVHGDGEFPRPIALPHDAMLGARRSADAPSRYHGAWFHGERYLYRNSWTPGAELTGKRVELIFEGVQRKSTVSVDGRQLASNNNGYREFSVDMTDRITPGRAHLIEVVADARDLPNGRWYSGAGIYRPVWLRVTDRTRLVRDGIAVRTESIGAEAVVAVSAEVDADAATGLTLQVSFAQDGREVAAAVVDVEGGRAEARLIVTSPRLWSDRDPTLYDCVVTLSQNGQVLDTESKRVGLRMITLDAQRGLLVNDVPTLLRGGNVHHDNGILGAVSTPAAEHRRARILKEVGFNAIRSAHNPISRAFLDACDEAGILVIDELTDVWWDPKTAHDDSADFEMDWPQDLASMVRRDRSHPSVFAYSIGNENGETGTRSGIELAHRMRELVRELDDSRPVTAGINLGLTSAAAAKARRQGDPVRDPAARTKVTHPPLDSTKFNILFAALGPLMEMATKRSSTERGTRAIFGELDIAGYNYGVARYQIDLALHPDRFIVGSETMPRDIARVWPIVETNPRLLGDFVWAAWDYLGETGIGTWTPGQRFAPLMKAYPALVAGPGVIDIAGHAGGQALLARAAWGVTDEPGIAVRPVQFSGRPTARAAWRGTDAQQSWSWRGMENRPAEVEVYASADEVELILNERTVGRKGAGAANGFVARFTVPYAPGVLRAVAVRGGRDVGASELRSAEGPLQLKLTPSGGDERMEFVAIQVVDAAGTVEMLSDVRVNLALTGRAELAGFGSAAPSTEESFLERSHTTYYGRALAAVRFLDPDPDQTSVVRLEARAAALPGAELELRAR